MDKELKQRIQSLASKYETKDFLPADPSSFMHKVDGAANREATAFLASCLSYGSRKQFFPKIQFIVDAAKGEVDHWVRSGEWRSDIPDTAACYYRLYTFHDMHCLIAAYEKMLGEWGSMKAFVAGKAREGVDSANSMSVTAIEAVAALCDFFAKNGAGKVVPKNTTSACKRVCMFLRWMVRTGLLQVLYATKDAGRHALCGPSHAMVPPHCRHTAHAKLLTRNGINLLSRHHSSLAHLPSVSSFRLIWRTRWTMTVNCVTKCAFQAFLLNNLYG